MRNHYLCVILVTIFAMFQNSAQESGACDIKKYQLKFSRCCEFPPLELSEKGQEIVYKCQIASQSKYGKISQQEKEECAEECYFKTAKLMTPDMKPDPAAIVSEYEEGFEKYPNWEETIIQSIYECARLNFKQPNSKCKSGALRFTECVGKNMFLKCPKESWIGRKDEKCLNMKQMFEKCDVKRRRINKRKKDLDSDEDDD